MKISNIAFTTFALMGVSFTSSFSPVSISVTQQQQQNQQQRQEFNKVSSLYMSQETEENVTTENKHEIVDELRSKLRVTRGPEKKVCVTFFSFDFIFHHEHCYIVWRVLFHKRDGCVIVIRKEKAKFVFLYV